MLGNDTMIMLFGAIAILGMIMATSIMFFNSPERMDRRNTEKWLKKYENEKDEDKENHE